MAQVHLVPSDFRYPITQQIPIAMFRLDGSIWQSSLFENFTIEPTESEPDIMLVTTFQESHGSRSPNIYRAIAFPVAADS